MDLVPVGLHWTVSPLGTSIALCLPYGDVNLSTAGAVWIIIIMCVPLDIYILCIKESNLHNR